MALLSSSYGVAEAYHTNVFISGGGERLVSNRVFWNESGELTEKLKQHFATEISCPRHVTNLPSSMSMRLCLVSRQLSAIREYAKLYIDTCPSGLIGRQ